MKILIFLLILQIQVCSAQTVVFKGEFIPENTTQLVGKIAFSIAGLGRFSSDEDGYIELTIPEKMKSFKMKILTNKWQLMHPRDPIIVPNDLNTIVPVYIKTSTPESRMLEDKLMIQEKYQLQVDTMVLSREIKALEEKIKKLNNNDSDLRLQLSQKEDSLRQLSSELIEINERVHVNKLATHKEVTETYNDFKNAVLNFREELDNLDYIFTNQASLMEFNKKIQVLNQTKDLLHEKHNFLIEDVRAYWRKSLGDSLAAFYQLALVDIFDDIILPLNESLIKDLRKSWNGNKPRVFAQRKAIRKTKEVINELTPMLKQLFKQEPEILSKLESL